MAAPGAEKLRNLAENSGLAMRLAREITGDVFFDAFNCGRYPTDASFYQILPLGVMPGPWTRPCGRFRLPGTKAGSSPPGAAGHLAMRPDGQCWDRRRMRGNPDAVLIVEFAEEDQAENLHRLRQLGETGQS